MRRISCGRYQVLAASFAMGGAPNTEGYVMYIALGQEVAAYMQHIHLILSQGATSRNM